MQTAHTLTPLIIEPKETAAIWGGDALVRRYNKKGDPSALLGESWECFDENRVRGGPHDGVSIAELRAQLGAALMGELDAAHPFPVLTKIIDARQALSVQVHPGDAYAQRVEHQRNGKTECWYVLDAQPGAELILGWLHPTNREEYERRVVDGSLGEMLRRVPVSAGDAFYLPAGTLHAIGAGIQLFETQQTSDLTYRIFDWNRMGTDGKPRELHVAKAADVLDFSADTGGAVQQLTYTVDGAGSTALIAGPEFAVELARARAESSLATGGVPSVVMSLDQPITLIVADSHQTLLEPWTTAIIPAAIERVSIGPSTGSHASALVVTPQRAAFERKLERGGVSASMRTSFLAQFEATATG